MTLGKWVLGGIAAGSILLTAGVASATVFALGTSPNNASGPYSNAFDLTGPASVTDFASFTITSNQQIYGTYAPTGGAITGSLEIFSGGSCNATTCTGGTSISTGTSKTTPVDVTPGSFYEEISSNVPVGRSGYFGAIFGQASGGGAIPEPATWSLMIIGLGLLGASLRMRDNRRAFVAS
jgi:hypothetical protein